MTNTKKETPNESGLTNSAAKQFMNGLVKAGEVYADKLANGFDMYY